MRIIQCGLEVRVAEGVGMKMGLLLASNIFLYRIVAESYYFELTNALRLKADNPSYFQVVIDDYLHIGNSLASCSFSPSKREGNKVAHCLAKFAYSGHGCTWLD